MPVLTGTDREVSRPLGSMNIEHLIELLNYLGNSKCVLAFKVFLTFGFFGLFRLSNMVPESKKLVDKTRNTLIGDVCLTSFGLVIKLKWTKTRQSRQYALVPLTILRDSILCPVKAWISYAEAFPGYCSNPSNILLTRDDSVMNIWTSGSIRNFRHYLTTQHIRVALKYIVAYYSKKKHIYRPIVGLNLSLQGYNIAM